MSKEGNLKGKCEITGINRLLYACGTDWTFDCDCGTNVSKSINSREENHIVQNEFHLIDFT